MVELNPVEIANAMRELTKIARKYGALNNDEVIDVAEYTYTIAIVIRNLRTDEIKGIKSIPTEEMMKFIESINYGEFEGCIKKHGDVKYCIKMITTER